MIPARHLGISGSDLVDRGGRGVFMAAECSDAELSLRGSSETLAGLSVGLAVEGGFFKCKLSSVLDSGRMASGPRSNLRLICANGRVRGGVVRAVSVRFMAGYVAVGVAVAGSV